MLRHFDVVIYDAINAPVLWVEPSADLSSQGEKRAIPVEHVMAVFEVKARLTKRTLMEALDKLDELNDFLVPDEGGASLPPLFFCTPIFFEFSTAYGEIGAADALSGRAPTQGMTAGLVLRNNDGDPEDTGRFLFLHRDASSMPDVSIVWSKHQFQMFAFEIIQRLAGKSGPFVSMNAMPPVTILG